MKRLILMVAASLVHYGGLFFPYHLRESLQPVFFHCLPLVMNFSLL